MNNLEKLNQNLHKVKSNINDFIQKNTEDLFYIIDIQGLSKIYDSCIDESECFKVINVENSNIFFIPIDGKDGLLGFKASYCDTIIFDNNYFCFLEFKLNATSVEIRAIRKNRKKAISQLSNTIDYFDNKLDKDYSGLNLEAFVVTPRTYPRKDTAWSNFEIEFLEKYGIPLFEKNEKIF